MLTLFAACALRGSQLVTQHPYPTIGGGGGAAQPPLSTRGPPDSDARPHPKPLHHLLWARAGGSPVSDPAPAKALGTPAG